jgi:hypothetical protein
MKEEGGINQQARVYQKEHDVKGSIFGFRLFFITPLGCCEL